MAWRNEKTKEGQDLVWDGVETGIAPSPTKGTANVQNANISTETGEVMASFGRTAQQQIPITGGTLTPDGATLFTAPATLKAGQWIQVTASTVTSITTGTGATTASVDYLVVAGGGGGGGFLGGVSGGGGAGALLTGSVPAGTGTYAITVGDGGRGGQGNTNGTNGSNSVISGLAITATGGGGGGNSVSGFNGSNGGSGGGAGTDGVTPGTGGTGTTGGNNGGTSRETATKAAGGGGGAGAVGTNGSAGEGGDGGVGLSSSISGTATFYAGGGGGGRDTNPGEGGNGGGGNGATTASGVPSDGTTNTGGGGGGGSDGAGIAGSGGSGIVIISYTTGTLYATGGDITFVDGKTVHTFLESGTFTVISINAGGYYFVSYKDTSNKVKLSASFDPYAEHALTHGTTGSVTFNIVTTPHQAIAKATERYGSTTSFYYRYYILDSSGYVWVYDSKVYESTLAASGVGTTWMLPDYVNYSTLNFAGMAVIAGWLIVPNLAYLQAKPTTDLGRPFQSMPGVALNNPLPTHTNYAITGSQGKMYYCDGTYLGEVFPTTSFVTNVANIQSNCSYTASSTVGTVTAVISDSIPWAADGTRIPVVFYTDRYGTTPTAIDEGTVYYIDYNPTGKTFKVYSSDTSSVAIDIATGAVGNQYFNTFFPFGMESGVDGDTPLLQFTSQRVNLPNNDTAQCLVEIGNTVLIGCSGNSLYPWNQVDATPSDVIAIPESNVRSMVNANNTAYIFAGNKGNVYISNISTASLAFKVPDYCAGVPGTPLTYIEPYFVWGDSMYLRGRVYFSILDQTATKAGNCGGVWSFVPSQNVDPTQEVGIALRLENQNSYADYDGYANILIPSEVQNAVSPQYWAAWQDSYSLGTSTFGIDFTAGTPVTTFLVETDLAPTGTLFSKDTFLQLEYKVTTPLLSGDAIQLYWRLNSTDAWTSAGTVQEETSDRLSGVFQVNFQKTQWAQFRALCTTGGTTASSFNRLKELRLR